jgi:hypothetical protein
VVLTDAGALGRGERMNMLQHGHLDVAWRPSAGKRLNWRVYVNRANRRAGGAQPGGLVHGLADLSC